MAIAEQIQSSALPGTICCSAAARRAYLASSYQFNRFACGIDQPLGTCSLPRKSLSNSNASLPEAVQLETNGNDSMGRDASGTLAHFSPSTTQQHVYTVDRRMQE